MLSFGAAAGLFGPRAEAQEPETGLPPPPTTTVVEAGHTFWKHPDYDAVVEIWTDPVKGLRGKIASLNPLDNKVREVVGKILKKDVKQVSDKDVMSFQGMEGNLSLHREGLKWTGTIYWPFKEKSYGVDVETPTDHTLHVRGYFIMLPFIGRSVDLQSAPPPKPKTP